MEEAASLTIEILKDIREEVRGTNARVDRLGERVDRLGERVDETNSRIDSLTRRVVESEVRTSTAIADLAGTVREMTSVLRAQSDLRPRVERCERDIDELKRRA